MISLQCSIFSDLTSNQAGTVINCKNHQVLISNCQVNHVSSSSYPGVIRIESSLSFSICHTSFSYCNGIGKNGQGGNVAFIFHSPSIIASISSNVCSPQKTTTADSLMRVQESSTKAKFFNSSYCYGSDGSSSLYYKHETISFDIEYLNVIHCSDTSSLECEITNKNKMTCSFSNFINASHNIYVLDIRTNAIFTTCVFMEFGDVRFSHNPDLMEFEDCISDQEVESVKFSSITSSFSLNFQVKIKNECKIHTLKLNCNRRVFFHLPLMILLA